MSESLEREAWELNKPGADENIAKELDSIGEEIKAAGPQSKPQEKSVDDEFSELITSEQKRVVEERDAASKWRWMLLGTDGDIARAKDFVRYYGTDAKLSVRYLLTEMEMRRDEIVSGMDPKSKFHDNPIVLDTFREHFHDYIQQKWITPDMTFPAAIAALEEKERELEEDIEAATRTGQT